ncbi:leucine-rich receptor-like protein kinase family protein [Striga asiatica]|uniref:non-specific serine/threonine protein kinase n=1 Tax=Striga asiatica TaxID=4170 RepID=A0A5A7PQY0_STRAF|nr:leucine-rich receptor-like protein kinase family protein [Striga asiatica]
MTLFPSFLLAVALLTTTTADPSPSLQLLSLLALKSSLSDPLNSFQTWNVTTAASPVNDSSRPVECSWPGVGCNLLGNRVTSLDLSGRHLSGSIPADVKYLTHLTSLNLSWNSFDGPLPGAVFELTSLRTLDINHNQFNSSFPAGISKLESLEFFNAFSNNFSGPLPEEVVLLENLEYLNLGGSYFEGEIPSSYGKFAKLRSLYLNGNSLVGRIPSELGSLRRLEHVELGYNLYSGEIPLQLFNLSKLSYLDLSGANLSGHLPNEIGSVESLQFLLLFNNKLSGPIPASWARMVSLQVLDLSNNNLSGQIPTGFSDLKELTTLSLMNNELTGEIPEGIGQLPNLEILSLWNNSLSGILPQSLGSNARLQKLDVSTNSLSGPIPPDLCLSNNLVKLVLFSNQFSGQIPPSLANCTALSRVRIQNNQLNGSIPSGFGSLPNLTYFELSKNRLSGSIPNDIVNAERLQFLNISENTFDSKLPENIWKAPGLQIFSASSANLTGKIPDFIVCRNFYKIELDGNNLTGGIPWDIGHCVKLIALNLRRNSLTGIIPWEISTLPSITDVDLSHNYLTGTIPSSFANTTTLENFNVSYNQLTGPIPSSGQPFAGLHPSSFAGNQGLCGSSINIPCRTGLSGGPSAEATNVHRRPKKTAGAIVWIVAAAFGVGLFVLIAGGRCFRAKYGPKLPGSGRREVGPWRLTAFQRLNFTADDILNCLDSSDKVLGMGSTGTVYKAEMPGGEIIAVKRLWAKNKENIRRRRSGVLAEVDVLGNVRHRNIVRLLGCCSNNQCTMLLYEYMPNGSLDDLLHGKNKAENLVADWVTRYKIALGVAQGICYLHHDCDPVIVHRDLKPSNILLDAEMEARVADFGVAKLIESDESMSVIAGSYGYIAPDCLGLVVENLSYGNATGIAFFEAAPQFGVVIRVNKTREYAYTLQVDEKSDIYSYGVVLMEILTGKRSVDAEFGDGNSIVDWVKSKMKVKSDLIDVLDKNAGASCAPVREEMMLLLRVALLCTSRNPAERPSMRDVVSMLQEAKPKRKLAGGDGGLMGCDYDDVIGDRDYQDVKKSTVEC